MRKEEDLELEPEDYDIIEKERINGRTFLKMTEEKFMQDGLKRGPASRLADFAKDCKEKKLRAFSTYRSLKEVLAKMVLTPMVRTLSRFFHCNRMR